MRDLIPDQYHLYVVIGTAILCTIITLIYITTATIRRVKRSVNSETHPSQHEQTGIKERKAMLLFNFGFLLIVHIALYLLLGFVDTLVAFGSYVAFIGLIGTYCDHQMRKKRKDI